MTRRPIRVLVVDDSRLMRRLLVDLLSASSAIEVVGTAQDAQQARAEIKRLAPDVITLDVEMPGMSGLQFLARLMRLRPLPVVMVSSRTHEGSAAALDALALGAVDVIAKPQGVREAGLACFAAALQAKVLQAAAVPVEQLTRMAGAGEGDAPHEPPSAAGPYGGIVAIGASTGGTEAIRSVLRRLPANMPPILLVQHIPLAFSGSLARRLDAECSLRVVHLTQTQPLRPGHAYLAGGERHMVVERLGTTTCARPDDAPARQHHRPSVDILFETLARQPLRLAAVLLTGMGTDGAAGLARLRQRGALTLAQDEASSMVWGMPGEAVRTGAAQEVLPLAAIATRLLRWTHERPAAARTHAAGR